MHPRCIFYSIQCERFVLLQVVNFLEKEFPSENMQFVREHLPVSPIPELLSKLVPICQAISIAWVIVGGKKLLRWLPMYRSGQRPLPRFYWIVQDNSIPILIFLFLLAPPLTKNLQVGNAVFDIYDKGNALIFSAKKAGLRPALLVDAFLKAGLVQSSSNAN